MAISLTTNFTLPPGARLEFGRFDFDDDAQTLTVRVELRSSIPNNRRLIAGATMQIRDGTCSTLARQAAPAPGLNIDDPTHYFIQGTRTVATGYTDAKTAERAAANTPGARRTALEAHMFSAGHIDATLAGT